jgi:HK97 family phage portal protein
VGLFFRGKQEARGIWSVPWADSMPSGRYRDVSVSSYEQSLQIVAFRSGVDLIASAVSELPIDVLSTGSGQARPVATPSYLLDPAGDGTGVEDWLYMLISSWLLKGNAFGDILAVARGGFPTQVDLQHPDRVGATPDGNGGINWTFNGNQVPASQVWHKRVNPIPGTLFGLSLIAAHAADMGLALTLTAFGKDYFDNGAHPSAVLKNTVDDLNSPRIARKVKDAFMNSLRSREPIVVGRKWDYTPISINPEESQFLETRGFTAAECANMLGPGVAAILGYQLPSGSSTLTYANVVDRSVHLLQYAIGKWVRRAQRILSSMLPRPQVVRLNTAALLQTTVMQRYQAHQLALGDQPWKTVNEVRKDEDLEPLPGGDVLPAPTPKTKPGDNASEGGEPQ